MDRDIYARTTPWTGMKMSMPLGLHKFKTEAGKLALQSQKHSPYFLFWLFLKCWQLCEQTTHAKVTCPQPIQNKQFKAGDWYSAGKNKLFLPCHCLLPAATLPGQLKHVLSPALCEVPGLRARRPVRLVQSPALLHRTALNPHQVLGAEKCGRAWGLPPYVLPEGRSALNLWRSSPVASCLLPVSPSRNGCSKQCDTSTVCTTPHLTRPCVSAGFFVPCAVPG